MLSDKPFTKENLDQYLKELAKEYRKRSGKNTPAEIILIGGASVVIFMGLMNRFPRRLESSLRMHLRMEITKMSIPIPGSMSWKTKRICLNIRRKSRE